MRAIKKIRKWLNSNKIFFEIAASLSVIFIAVQANNISKIQVENSELINQPNFKINKLPNGNLLINSDSYRYNNLELSTASLLRYTYTTINLKDEVYVLHLPEDLIIYDNFRSITYPDLSKEIELGLVEETDSLFLASKNAMQTFFEKKLSKTVEIGNYSLQTFLEISYFDFKGNEQVLYFDITRNPRRVPEWQAKPVIDEKYNSIYLDLMGYEFLDDILYPRNYYDKNGNRIYFIESLDFYYDEEGRKIRETDSAS